MCCSPEGKSLEGKTQTNLAGNMLLPVHRRSDGEEKAAGLMLFSVATGNTTAVQGCSEMPSESRDVPEVFRWSEVLGSGD